MLKTRCLPYVPYGMDMASRDSHVVLSMRRLFRHRHRARPEWASLQRALPLCRSIVSPLCAVQLLRCAIKWGPVSESLTPGAALDARRSHFSNSAFGRGRLCR